MKRLPVLIGIPVLLLLLVLFLLFFPQKKASDTNNLAFPESGASVPRAGQAGGTEGSAGVYPVVNTNAPATSATVPRTTTNTPTPYVVPPLSSNTPASGTGSSGFFGLNVNTDRGANSYVPRIPLIITPIAPTYQPPYYAFSTSTPGPRIIGHARNGDQITFDPITGDLHVGEYHFNFGMGPVPNGATSDVVGDPENVTLGNTIGIFIGSLIGDPGLGLTLGTALGSNLVSGFRLSDFGIGLDNGLVTLGGQDAISALTGGAGLGDLLGSSGLGSVTGALGVGGTGYFGGRVIAIECTCSKGDFLWTNVGTAGPGMYLFSPLSSRIYANYVFAGTFNAVGSYSVGTDICYMAGDPCTPIKTRGKVNASPGAGTSGI